MAQKTNLNTTPYFDDFNENDNFYKVLFKPGFPVQARELNNAQSILQNQIEKFGDHFFKDGSVVIPGGITYDSEYYSVKINPEYLGVSVEAYAQNFIGTEILGQTSRVTASVVNVLLADDSDDDQLTIYVKYLNSSEDGEFSTFTESELLLAEDDVTYGNTTIFQGSAFAQVVAKDATAIGSAISIADGIYFVRGFFVNVLAQTIILDQYTNNPTYRVGLDIIETTVNSNENTKLFDNAAGFNNFSAPGADRFKFQLQLTKKLVTDEDDKEFVEILRLNDGETDKAEQKTQYNQIRDYFAQRTYEESGDYTVVPMDLTMDECLNDEQGNDGIYERSQTTRSGNVPTDDLMCLTVGPGKAYVNGYDIDISGSRVVDIPKPRTTKRVDNSLVAFDLGSVLMVENVHGTPVIGLDKDSTHVIDLYDQRRNSTTAGTGEKVGEARIYSFAPRNSYSSDATNWELRLFDIQTYTELTLNEVYQYSKGTYFKGNSSGASGYAAEAWTSGDKVKLHQTSGTFAEGETISIDGTNEFPRTIKDMIVYDINSVKSVYQDASTLGLTADFVADTLQRGRVAPRFTRRDTVQITSGGTVTSPGNKFTGIATNSIIRYQNPEYDNVVFNRVSAVAADGDSMTIVAVPTVAGVVTGTLPSGTIETGFRIGQTRFEQGDNGGSLFLPLDQANIASVDISGSNLTIYDQILAQSTNAQGEMSINISNVGVTSSFFDAFDGERYVITYSDGSTERLRSEQFTLNSDGTEISFSGLKRSESNVTVLVTAKKRGLQSKLKQWSRSTKLTVDKSKLRSSGISTGTVNGMNHNAFYGLRVEDEEISLNYPDVAEILAVYESKTSEAPVLDALTFETGLALDTNSILGEYILGPDNNAVAQIVTRSSPTKVEIVYLNDDRFSVGETLTFQESKIEGTIQAIIEGRYVDITEQYILDDGQRPDFSDYSRLVRVENKVPTKQLLVIFNHYVIPDSDDGDAFTVLSYGADRFKNDIPDIFDPNNFNQFSFARASDTLDFRPRVAPFGTEAGKSPFDYDSRDFSVTGSSSPLIPKDSESSFLSYDFYLGRMDRILLTPEGEIEVVEGVPSEDPQVPSVVEDSMTLATLESPPYVYNVESTRLTLIDNKRFTMRDIGALQDRIENLEDTVSLSILENDTRSLEITDADGLSRFKTGFFADDFTNNDLFDSELTTMVVDPGIEQLSCEASQITLTPQLQYRTQDDVNTLDLSSNDPLLDTNCQKTGNVVSLRYEEIEYLKQAYATRVENVNPFSIIDYVGTILLQPAQDTWTETKVSNKKRIQRQFKTLNTKSQNVVEKFRVGKPKNGPSSMKTTTKKSTKVDTSVSTSITDVSTKIDSKTTKAKYMRERNVSFFADGLKPFTRYYGFYDGSRKVRLLPKLVEIKNVQGSFQVGEIVEIWNRKAQRYVRDGRFSNIAVDDPKTKKFKRARRTAVCRLARPNHKSGRITSPSDVYTFNPYNRGQDISRLTSYNSSSTFLNLDILGMSRKAQGKFFGNFWSNYVIIGRKSGAVATVSRKRLMTDGIGSLYGNIAFAGPKDVNARFKTGTKVFKLTNDSKDTVALPGQIKHSDAEAPFTSSGTITRTTLTTTIKKLVTTTKNAVTTVTKTNVFRMQRLPPPQIIVRREIVERTRVIEPRIIRETRVLRERVVVRPVPRRDPLAQSFTTDKKGAFISSVDIYMATKDRRAPLTVELRTIQLGLPTLQLVSQEAQVVLQPSQINISDDASVATRVTFSAPIPVEPETEYCIVLLAPTSIKYNAWIAKLGEKTVNTAELSGPESQQYTRQYGSGSLYKSQNGSIWTPCQFEDMKFRVNKCRFLVDNGTVTFHNPDIDRDGDQLPDMPEDPIKSLPRQLDVGITTVLTQGMKDVLQIGRKVGTGSLVTGVIGNVGGTIQSLKANLPGIGYSDGTYSNVNFFSLSGDGSGATGIVTIANGVLSSASIANTGTGYIAGESLGITTADVTKGTGAQISISAIDGVDTLYLTNVRGEHLVVDDPLVYYDDSGNAQTLNTGVTTAVRTSIVSDELHSGNVIEVLHPNHALKDTRNVVDIYNVDPTRIPSELNVDINATVTSIGVADTSPYGTFQGITTSAGYILVDNEVMYYNSIGNGTLGIATRGAEGTTAVRHAAGDEVYPYEFNDISLTQINKVHNIPSAVVFQANKTIDTYYIEIDRGNRRDGPNMLNFASEFIAGGDEVFASGNIQYDRLNCRLDIVTPKKTKIETRVRTISGTSAGGNEASFVDQGFLSTEPNATLLFGQPQMVCSKVNEEANVTGLPRNKSFTVEVDLQSTDSNYSPFIYLNNCSIDFDRSRVDNPISDYTTDSRVNSIQDDPHAAIYVSDRIDLKNPATSLKLFTAAYVDPTADIRALFRTFPVDSGNTNPSFVLFPGFDNLTDTDGDNFGDQVIDPSKNSGKPDQQVISVTVDEMREYQFSIDELPPFTAYQIKIVFSGTNECLAPRMNDLRTIALA
jgi:hypothetical protein